MHFSLKRERQALEWERIVVRHMLSRQVSKVHRYPEHTNKPGVVAQSLISALKEEADRSL